MIYRRSGHAKVTRVKVDSINIEVKKIAGDFELIIDGWSIQTIFAENLSQQATAILESLAAQEAI